MQKPMKASAEGRKCRYPGCDRTLSIYNHEAYCHNHRDLMAEQEKRKNTPPLRLYFRDIDTQL